MYAAPSPLPAPHTGCVPCLTGACGERQPQNGGGNGCSKFTTGAKKCPHGDMDKDRKRSGAAALVSEDLPSLSLPANDSRVSA